MYLSTGEMALQKEDALLNLGAVKNILVILLLPKSCNKCKCYFYFSKEYLMNIKYS